MSVGTALLSFFVFGSITAETRPQETTKETRCNPHAEPLKLVIPAGTILPIRLHSALSSKNASPGQHITGRIMQDVPLPNRQKIKAGAKVTAEITEVAPASSSGHGQISFHFDKLQIGRQQISIQTCLRALASLLEVSSAQIYEQSIGFGTPATWATTDQVGGDVVYGVGGPVINATGETVGIGANDGVLAKVRAKAGTDCRGAVAGNDQPQALWVFSTDACGPYGYPNVRIVHAGRREPVGQVTLAAVTGDLKLRGGSGMLLRTVSAAE
jgi:hypothetical protein